MGDFVSQDWGLQAIVSDDHSAAMFDPFVMYQQNHNMHDDFVINLFNANTSTLSNEFDQIYNPFYPVVDDSLSQHFDSFSEQMNIVKPAEEMRQQKSSKSTTNAHAVLKYKKRKNQQKRVVLQPEGQPSDNWAWRKYGQKPIKGSPYPRSYYKCSSSKGCLARKQVEQSHTDPGMFRITYSAEHNHSEPTRRSSLAGKNRHKFTLQNTSSSSTDDASFGTSKDSGASPTTPLTPTSIIQEMILAHHIKNEENIDGSKNECIFSDEQDMLLNDDFFVGLENLDGLISDSALLHTY